MTVQDDRMWADVLDAHTPNAAEMAAAEAGLQDLGEVAPLPAADVEALVEVATKTPSVTLESRGVVGTVSRARRFRQPLLQAAAAVLLLMTVAWVARELVSVGTNPKFTLPYAKAVDLAQQPGHSDADYRHALGQIVDECGEAANTLRSLADQDAYPTIAKRARLVSLELVDLLTNGPSAPAAVIDRSLREAAKTTADASLPVDVREKALDLVKELAKSGFTAMLLADLAGDEAKQLRDACVARLLSTLPH